MKSQAKKTALTVKQQIVSYLNTRRTPATRSQIVTALRKTKESTVLREISFCVNDGLIQKQTSTKALRAKVKASSVVYTSI